MQTNQLTEETLRALSEVEADEPVVVSMFVDLNPTDFAAPPARESQFNSLLNELDERIRAGELSHDARVALGADRERIESYLTEELDASGAHGVAIFSASALDVFKAIKLAAPIDSGVHVGQRPLLEPVMGHEDEGEWCILLVTRDRARIFRGGPTGIRELRRIDSNVKNQHQQGGWSQARYERSVDREVEWHLEAATEALFRHFKRRPFEHLVIGANDEGLRPSLMSETHAYLRERVRGWVDIDESLASEDEVFEAVRGVMDEHLAQHERGLLERFTAERGTDGRVALGVTDVLAALIEQKVETLLVREGAAAEGTKCMTCGWIGTAGHVECPVDGTKLDRVGNVVEPAIQAAIQQSAGVHVLRGDAPFDEPLAAILRY